MSNQDHHEKPHKENCCTLSEVAIFRRRCPAPWISRVFDAMGLVFIAVAIVLFFISWLSAETKFYIALCVSFFISGLLYTAAGDLLRSTAETARNTAKLVDLKIVKTNSRGFEINTLKMTILEPRIFLRHFASN